MEAPPRPQHAVTGLKSDFGTARTEEQRVRVLLLRVEGSGKVSSRSDRRDLIVAVASPASIGVESFFNRFEKMAWHGIPSHSPSHDASKNHATFLSTCHLPICRLSRYVATSVQVHMHVGILPQSSLQRDESLTAPLLCSDWPLQLPAFAYLPVGCQLCQASLRLLT